MAVKVVDSSALAALSFQEPEAAQVRSMLTGHELHAPALLRFEMTNICLSKIKRHPARRNELVDMHRNSLRIVIRQHIADQDEVLSVAEQYKLTGYDTAFLWLAIKLNAELVTLDTELIEAAQKI